MKTFAYRGYGRDGGKKRGVVEALDLKDARDVLSREGIFSESVVPASAQDPAANGFARGRGIDRVAVRAEFYRAMSALTRAGLPLAAAFDVIMDQPSESGAGLTRDVAGIRDRVRDGEPFTSALALAVPSISAFEIAVLESGEKTASLPDVFQQLAEYLDDINQLRQTLRTACLYPLVIVALALVVGAGVMGFLVPQMAAVFEESGMKLPLITRVVVAAGTWFLPVVLPLTVLTLAGAIWWFRRLAVRPDARRSLEAWLSRVPFVRNGFRLLVTSRFARTCALLLGGGLPLVDAISLSGRATGSIWLAGILEEKAQAVRQGQAFSQALAEVPVLGPSLSSWVRAGEASGDLAGLFNHAAGRNHQLWTAYVQRAVTLIEPALIILVALFVLVVALAILLPILSLNQQLA